MLKIIIIKGKIFKKLMHMPWKAMYLVWAQFYVSINGHLHPNKEKQKLNSVSKVKINLFDCILMVMVSYFEN